MIAVDKKMTPSEYAEFVKQETPGSNIFINCLKAFVSGGLICAFGQGLLNLYTYLGLTRDNAGTMVSVTLIFFGALLTGLNIYPKIAKHAGAGTVVPITGFANSVAAPALEAKTEGYVLGVGAKIFTIAGPVILFGTLASAAAGIVYMLI